MIDVHAHILPGVDDGPAAVEDSLKMLQMAQDDGTHTIVATPHVFSSINKFSDREEYFLTVEYPARLQELRKAALEWDIKVNILQGAEVFFVSDLREKLERYGPLLTINGSAYFLLEFPADIVFPGSETFLGELVSEGFIPILCHPERNLVFQQNPHLLFRLLAAGALSQVDAGSLKGYFGAGAFAAARLFLKYNLVHLVASDCHAVHSRVPGMSFIFRQCPFIDAGKLQKLVEDVPLAIIHDKVPSDTGPLQDPNQKPHFFDMLRSIFE